MATDIVSLVYRKRQDQSPPEAILSAILDANHQIHSRGLASPDFRGMGTTATALVLLPAGAMVAHVGDSRAYRLRGVRLEQLTFDHSLVWEIRAAGQMPDAEVPSYISKNIITRSLGPNAAVQVDLEGALSASSRRHLPAVQRWPFGPGHRTTRLAWFWAVCRRPKRSRRWWTWPIYGAAPDNITVVVIRVLGPQIAQNVPSNPSNRRGFTNVQPIHPLVWTLNGRWTCLRRRDYWPRTPSDRAASRSGCCRGHCRWRCAALRWSDQRIPE